MRDNQCDRIKLVAIRYEEQIGNISREEADEARAAQIERIYKRDRLVR